MHPLGQTVWGDIWKHTVEKKLRNATSVNMPVLIQAAWGDIWRHTVEKVKKMQPMLLCLFSGRRFEETFENTQWRKVKQMRPMWLCIFSGSQFEGPSKETQLQFGDNLNIFVNIWMYTISVCPYCAIPLILLLTKNICIITLYPILCGRWNGTSSILFGIYIIGLQHSPYGHINWKNT